MLRLMGRAVIAMTAVRNRARVEPGKVTDLSDVRPPTDVMAITSLPPLTSDQYHRPQAFFYFA